MDQKSAPVALTSLEESLGGVEKPASFAQEEKKAQLLADAFSEVFAVFGIVVKLVAVLILFFMLEAESPVQSFYPVHRAVKRTFLVEQAMEVTPSEPACRLHSLFSVVLCTGEKY